MATTPEVAIRRSSRRVNKRRNSDTAEVNESKAIGQEKGRRTAKSTDLATNLRRYVVCEGDNDHHLSPKEQEISSTSCDEIASKNEPDAIDSTEEARNGWDTAKKTTTNTSNTTKSRGGWTPSSSVPSSRNGSVSEGLSACSVGRGKKRVTFDKSDETSADNNHSYSFVPSANKKKKANGSSREERIHRRQAALGMDQEKVSGSLQKTNANTNTKSKQRHAAANRVRKNGRFVSTGKNGKPLRGAAATAVANANKDVIRVPMLTGTLFLYRGLHRRAEFVRHV